jgi:hypothetical protein
MIVSLRKQAAELRLASLSVASYMIRNEAKVAVSIFHGKSPKG